MNSDVVRAQIAPGELRKQPDEKPAQKDAPKKDQPKKEAPKKDEAKESAWSRKHVSGPEDFEGWHASYTVKFNHVLPPVPQGVTQLWQVVDIRTETLNDKCKVETGHLFIVDIADIGARKEIGDEWSWDPKGDPCFAREVCSATVGFDDGKDKFDQQTNRKASESQAKNLLRRMKGPKGTYTGIYTYVNRGSCMKCEKELEELKKKHSAPDQESLSIDGVGSFTTASMKRP